METAAPQSEDEGGKVQGDDNEDTPAVVEEATSTPPVEEVELTEELALEDKEVSNVVEPDAAAVAPVVEEDENDDEEEAEGDKAPTNGTASPVGGASASSKSKKKNDKKKQKKKAAAAGKVDGAEKVEGEEVDLNA